VFGSFDLPNWLHLAQDAENLWTDGLVDQYLHNLWTNAVQQIPPNADGFQADI